MSRDILFAKKIIQFEEGLRLLPYYDHLGFPTIGYGKLLGKKGDPLPDIKWTAEQAVADLDEKLKTALVELTKNKVTKDAWASLKDDDDRKAIVLSMWYQLGIDRLDDFKGTLAAIVDKNWEEVSKRMSNSLAAKQTPKRWKRQTAAMLSGNVLNTYNF